MSNLGIGVMLNRLSSNKETVDAVKNSLGKTIEKVSLNDDDKLTVKFSDGKRLRLWDDGQSCCEHRYMTTDDNLANFKNAVLQDVEIASCEPTIGSEYGDAKEIQFLRLKTSEGIITF